MTVWVYSIVLYSPNSHFLLLPYKEEVAVLEKGGQEYAEIILL
jgi:hypothetical protein